jgi:transcriptional regulator with XRE-family HTH domain
VKRLKELRQAHGLTQEALAKALQTTQQTIARWETYKAEPNLSALRDLAMIFGTSVDDLVGSNPISKKVTTTTYTLFTKGDQDGYWGNVGILLPGEQHARWYPITSSERMRIANALNNNDSQFVCFSTLNNRMIAMNTAHVRRVWLLDEACDQPEGDWEVEWDSVEGCPLEFYRALEDYTLSQEDFRASASPTLISMVEDRVKEEGWDEEAILRITNETLIWFSDGHYINYSVDEDDLWGLIAAFESEEIDRMIRLDESGGDFESFYPRDKIALVEMPLLRVMEAAKHELRDLKDDAPEADSGHSTASKARSRIKGD